MMYVASDEILVPVEVLTVDGLDAEGRLGHRLGLREPWVVPAEALLTAEVVDAGGYAGTGRRVLRRLFRRRARDPLTVPFGDRPSVIERRKALYDRRWIAAVKTKAREGAEFNMGRDHQLRMRERITVRLRDGARGVKWTPWEVVPYEYGHPDEGWLPRMVSPYGGAGSQ